MDLFWEILGYIAAALTTASFIPQIVTIIKLKDTKSISIYMYIMYVIGVIMWLIYGIATKNIPLAAANAVGLAFASVILVCKIINVVKRHEKM